MSIKQAYEQYRNYRPPMPETPWENDFREVTLFLEQKLMNFIRLNPRLRENIVRRSRFLKVKDSEIHIDLAEFNFDYQTKFILADFEKYCNSFVALLEPVLADFLNEIQYGGHGFVFQFRLGGHDYTKRKTVLVNKAD